MLKIINCIFVGVIIGYLACQGKYQALLATQPLTTLCVGKHADTLYIYPALPATVQCYNP